MTPRVTSRGTGRKSDVPPMLARLPPQRFPHAIAQLPVEEKTEHGSDVKGLKYEGFDDELGAWHLQLKVQELFANTS